MGETIMSARGLVIRREVAYRGAEECGQRRQQFGKAAAVGGQGQVVLILAEHGFGVIAELDEVGLHHICNYCCPQLGE
jgi:hypothetical protein